jgi:hypothetical protein
MHIDILTEDLSGENLLNIIVPQLLAGTDSTYKSTWAITIGQNMNIFANRSPSFNVFARKITELAHR